MASFQIAEGHVDIEAQIDEPQIRRAARMAANMFAGGMQDDSSRHRRDFFRSMFTPSPAIVSTLRTGIPAALGSPIGAAAIALGGVFAASFAGAVISSGALATVAGGFTALAAVALQENEMLQREWTQTGEHIQSVLAESAEPMVPAFQETLEMVRGMFATQLAGPLNQIFENLAPTIEPFVQSLGQTIANVLNSLSSPEFLEGMETVLDSIARELPRLGTGIGKFFETLAGDADDVAEAFGGVITVTNGLIGILAELTVVLTDAFNRFNDLGRSMSLLSDPTMDLAQSLGLAKEETGFLEFAGGQLLGMFDMLTLNLRNVIPEMLGWKDSSDEAGKAASRSGEKAREMARAMEEEAAEAVRVLQERMQDLGDSSDRASEKLSVQRENLSQLEESLFGAGDAALAAHDAEIQYQEAIDNVTASVKENGEATDINTEAGRANMSALIAQAEAGLGFLEAQRQLGASTEDLTKLTGTIREEFITAADKAGLNADEAKRLADMYGLVPEDVRTKLEAIDNTEKTIDRLERRLAELEARQTIVDIGIRRVEDPASIVTPWASGMAHGGVVGARQTAQGGGPRSNNVLVHEDEVLNLPFGTNVIPSAEQARGPFPSPGEGGGRGGDIIIRDGGSLIGELKALDDRFRVSQILEEMDDFGRFRSVS